MNVVAKGKRKEKKRKSMIIQRRFLNHKKEVSVRIGNRFAHKIRNLVHHHRSGNNTERKPGSPDNRNIIRAEDGMDAHNNG